MTSIIVIYHASSEALGMAETGWSAHHFGPQWNTTGLEWIAMQFGKDFHGNIEPEHIRHWWRPEAAANVLLLSHSLWKLC